MTVNSRRSRTLAEVREDAIRTGRVSETQIAEGVQKLRARQRAYRLAEIRKAHGLTQVQVAKAMHVSQRRVSAVENGKLDSTELGTVTAYVEALGGKVEVWADFGDQKVAVG